MINKMYRTRSHLLKKKVINKKHHNPQHDRLNNNVGPAHRYDLRSSRNYDNNNNHNNNNRGTNHDNNQTASNDDNNNGNTNNDNNNNNNDINNITSTWYEYFPKVVCRRIRLGEGRDWFGFEDQDRGMWWRSNYIQPCKKKVLIGGWSRNLPGGLQMGTM